MKIALLTDTHFGVRNDSPIFIESAKDFFDNIFFPELRDRNIGDMIFLGDLFDRRKYVNFKTLDMCQKHFIQPIIDGNIKTHLIVGNHDTFFKNTNRINCSDQLFSRTDLIKIYSEVADVDIYGNSCLFVPWINSENREKSLQKIIESPSRVLFGHLEVDGFDYVRGIRCVGGLSRELFGGFNRVFSGHFHQSQQFGAIHYLGTPYEMTFSDLDEEKGFYILDTDDMSVEFVKNPDKKFIKFVYSDSTDTKSLNYSIFKEKFVKVIVTEKTDTMKFDLFLETLISQEPIKVSMIEEFHIAEDGDTAHEYTGDDTPTLLSKFVDEIDITDGERENMKAYMKEIYLEASALEN